LSTQKVKGQGYRTFKTLETAAYLAYVYLWLANRASGDSGANCKLGLGDD